VTPVITGRRAIAIVLAVAVTALRNTATAAPPDYTTTDTTDRQTLERALYLCQWKTRHDVPDTAPIPAVCKSAAVSIDDATLQDKQWWTFWARLNPDEALKANQQFSADFAGFRARLALQPERAGELLPPGITLQSGDWRLWLVRRLGTSRIAALSVAAGGESAHARGRLCIGGKEEFQREFRQGDVGGCTEHHRRAEE
jgi:hypothetical protein